MKVLICDDDQQVASRWANRIKALTDSEASIDAVDVKSDLQDQIIGPLRQRQLEERGEAEERGRRLAELEDDEAGYMAILEEESPVLKKIPSIVDDYDLLILDNDVIREGVHAFESGAELAYLARSFSTCGLIVVLNQFEWRFNLRLQDELEDLSFADFDISSSDVDRPELWHTRWEGRQPSFRPWSWFPLKIAVRWFQQLVEHLGNRLHDPILEDLGLDEKSVPYLSQRAKDHFDQEREGPLAELTFWDFIRRSRLGIRAKDAQTSPSIRRRLAAARVSKWLRRYVLPSQNVLIDAPHLVSRRPDVLSGDPAICDAWNRTCSYSKPSDLGLNLSALPDAVTSPNTEDTYPWLPFPVWSWKEVEDKRSLRQLIVPQFRFCEDTSRFHDDVRAISTDVDGSYSERWINSLSDTNGYMPRTRLYT